MLILSAHLHIDWMSIRASLVVYYMFFPTAKMQWDLDLPQTQVNFLLTS